MSAFAFASRAAHGPPAADAPPIATIAIVFALDAEWAPWRARRAFRRAPAIAAATASAAPPPSTTAAPSTCGPPAIPVYESRAGRIALRVLVSGVGPTRAAACAAHALDRPVDALLVCGFGGGLRDRLRAGDVTVARRVSAHASDASVAGDPALIALAARCGAIVVDSTLTADRVIATAAEKTALGRAHDVVEMEAFPLLAEAAARGIPGVTLRVVGDTAGEDLPPALLRAMRPDATIDTGRLFRQVLSRPWRWRALWRLVAAHGRARRELLALLDRFLAEYEAARS